MADNENIPEKKKGWFSKLFDGLAKTRDSIVEKVDQLVKYYRDIDAEFYEELEEILISADVGVTTAGQIIQQLKKEVDAQKIGDTSRVREMLSGIIAGMLEGSGAPELKTPAVILIVGVNGVGKTTAIGKLAHHYRTEGKRVLLAAADTFRAAAAEQLTVWAQRAGVPIVTHQEGADPAAVVFDAISSAKARGTDILIVDTAGRLHNKKNLMDELTKIHRVIQREYPEAHRETWLVLDATTGQNAISQAKVFSQAVSLSGLILTKLDGTAKGGVVLAIQNELPVPVRFIGVGEGQSDLQVFDPQAFGKAML